MIFSNAICRCRYPVTRHEILRKDLATLESGCRGGGPDDPQPTLGKKVHDSGHKWRLWTYKRKIDML